MAESFTATEIDEFKECFCLYDGDNDGIIGQDELELIMRSLGEAVTYIELVNIMKTIGKEKIKFPDFLKIMAEQKKRSVDAVREMLEAFAACDPKKTGSVSRTQLQHILVNTGEKIARQEFEQMLHDFNLGQGPTVRYADLVRELTKVN